jgi:hypothetical protein
VYLGIVETQSGSLRLSRDLIRDCDLSMRLLDSSVGVFAITSLGKFSPLLAFSIGEWISWCVVSALPVQ